MVLELNQWIYLSPAYELRKYLLNTSGQIRLVSFSFSANFSSYSVRFPKYFGARYAVAQRSGL